MIDVRTYKRDENRYHVILLAAIVLISFFLRFYHLGYQSIWLDEGFSIWFAKLSTAELFLYPEENPPLYYIILHWWVTIFGFSEVSIRFPSLLCGVISVFMIYKVAGQLFNKEAGIFSALLLGLSKFHIEYSQEARTYSLTVLLTLISMYYFIKLLRKSNQKVAIGYILSSSLLMYSHVYGLFIIIAQHICFFTFQLVSKQSSTLKLKSWILLQMALFILFFPRMIIFIDEISKVQEGYYILKPSINKLYYAFIKYSGSTRVYLLLILLAMISPLTIKKHVITEPNVTQNNMFHFFNNFRWRISLLTTDRIIIVSIWLLTPILLPFIISQITSPIYKIRYTIVASLAFYILVARGINNINQKFFKLSIIIIIIAFSFLSIWRYNTNYQKEPWREVTHYIESNAEDGDILLFNSGIQGLTFNYYSNRADLVKKRFPEQKQFVINEESIKDLLPTIKGYKRVWLVISHSIDDQGLIAKKLADTCNLSYFRKYHNDLKVYLFESKLS